MLQHDIGIGLLLPFKKSQGWRTLEGQECHWIWLAEIIGFNGRGGYWFNEHLQWSTGGTHSVQPRTLTYEASEELDRQIEDYDKETRLAVTVGADPGDENDNQITN